ncbi:MAG: YHS domain-containing (seleno)protein [Burkholderiales bacterium]
MARLTIAFLAALLVGACGSMNVISDGADSNLMLRGYDPVAYFTAGKPTVGRPDIKTEHRGVTYRFASEQNRRLFITAPGRYVPQYGGFCANGLVCAIPLGGEAENFKIIEGKLYMFGGIRSKLYFEMDQERNLKLADGYWESEVKDSDWRIQSWKRLLARVPHYKSNRDLAEQYERRFGKKPG